MYDLDFKTENNDKSQRKTGEELMEVYKEFVTNYPMVSIEDPFDQDDFPTCAARSASICIDTHRYAQIPAAPPHPCAPRTHRTPLRAGHPIPRC